MDQRGLVAGAQFVVEIGILVAENCTEKLSRASRVHQISNVCLAANGGIAWYSPLDESISHIVDGTQHNIHQNIPIISIKIALGFKAGKIHVPQIRFLSSQAWKLPTCKEPKALGAPSCRNRVHPTLSVGRFKPTH